MIDATQLKESDFYSQQPVEIVPAERTTFELIGKGMALIHEGIALDESMQERLFNKIFPAETPTMDYVNLATDEIAPDPNDKKSVLKQYEKLQPIKRRLKHRLQELFTGKSQEKTDYLRKLREMRESDLKTGEKSEFLVKDRQSQDFAMKSLRVFPDRETDEYHLFLDEVRKNPNKPILIINGHSGTGGVSFGKKTWEVGESDSDLKSDLESIFLRMKVDSNKYSAVLLVACNEGNLTPPKQGDTPIFYVDGLAAYHDGKKTKVG